jgi:hypothetical protein
VVVIQRHGGSVPGDRVRVAVTFVEVGGGQQGSGRSVRAVDAEPVIGVADQIAVCTR